jgi:uncharacterized protein
MTAKKQKQKDRRRARKLAEQAWEAFNDDNLDMAVKIIRRATATQPENPVLWNDQGVILAHYSKYEDAEASYRTALSLAPDFADPYANLAALRIGQGFVREAISLQERAVNLAPQNAAYAQRLEGYRSLVREQKANQPVEKVPPCPRDAPPIRELDANWVEQLAMRDWETVESRLTTEGCALLPQLLDAETCAFLAELFDKESLFAKTVVMDRANFGLGTYRYFRAPLPAIVDDLRRTLYPHVAGIANAWQLLLREPERYPLSWEEFREQCHRAGQSMPTPILLKYGPGGFNALHRDIRGSVYFPIQLAVVLSPRADANAPTSEGFVGGEFLLCDVPERPKARRRAIAAGLGDALLFCTRDRLLPVGGVYGLQPVKHGVRTITSGTRFVLGIPFHDYR